MHKKLSRLIEPNLQPYFDLPVVRPEHRHGQGGVEHTVLADGVHAAGDGLDILHDPAFEASRLVVAILVLDNYEEMMKAGGDAGRSSIQAQVDERLGAWVAGTGRGPPRGPGCAGQRCPPPCRRGPENRRWPR